MKLFGWECNGGPNGKWWQGLWLVTSPSGWLPRDRELLRTQQSYWVWDYHCLLVILSGTCRCYSFVNKVVKVGKKATYRRSPCRCCEAGSLCDRRTWFPVRYSHNDEHSQVARNTSCFPLHKTRSDYQLSAWRNGSEGDHTWSDNHADWLVYEETHRSIIMTPTSVGRVRYKMTAGVCLSVCLSVCPSVCLSVCSVPRPNSRTKRPRKPKSVGWKPIIYR